MNGAPGFLLQSRLHYSLYVCKMYGMPTKKRYRLIPELIPADLWGRSAYRMLGSKAVWKKKIRPEAVTAANGLCEICKSDIQPLICHDKWSYNDKTREATLIGFEVHCRNCDTVTHLGRAIKVSGTPEEVLLAALKTISAVNKCSSAEAEQIVKKAINQWLDRSNMKWKILVSPSLIEKYPELEILPIFATG